MSGQALDRLAARIAMWLGILLAAVGGALLVLTGPLAPAGVAPDAAVPGGVSLYLGIRLALRYRRVSNALLVERLEWERQQLAIEELVGSTTSRDGQRGQW